MKNDPDKEREQEEEAARFAEEEESKNREENERKERDRREEEERLEEEREKEEERLAEEEAQEAKQEEERLEEEREFKLEEERQEEERRMQEKLDREKEIEFSYRKELETEYLKDEKDRYFEQASNEYELAKDLVWIDKEDGTRLYRTSKQEDLREYKDELMKKIRANWEDGSGYVQEDELKWSALEQWTEGQLTQAEREDFEFRNTLENIEKATQDLSEEFDEYVGAEIEYKTELYTKRGFFKDYKGDHYSSNTPYEELVDRAEEFEEERFFREEIIADKDALAEHIDVSAKQHAIEEWIKPREREIHQEQMDAKARGLEIEWLENKEGDILSDRSSLEDLVRHKVDLEQEFDEKFVKGEHDERYLELISDRAAIDSWIEKQSEGSFSVNVKELEAKEQAKLVSQIERHDGQIIGYDSSPEQVAEFREGLEEHLAKLSKEGDRSQEYYEIVSLNEATKQWTKLQELEQAAKEKGSIELGGIEVPVEGNKLFEEDLSLKDKLERIERAEFHLEASSTYSGKSVDKESLKEELRSILDGETGRANKIAIFEKLFDDGFEPFVNQEKHVEDGFEAYKDEHSEQSHERDELDELIGFPEDEREFDKEVEFLDKGDTGSVGERADNNEQSVDKGSEPTVEASQTDGGRDHGVVDNTDGFRGRDDDNDRDRDDDGLSR
ncbi:MAG: hypothetical protein KC652_12410 [Cyanobacteria bacterium HKST-UBA01]|nr:hypothetical protein [Cyanobacteria bacterium HKST-UBA01]